MKCEKCGGKGYIESFTMRDARPDGQGMLLQCCDITAYSNEVSRRNGRTVDNKPMVQDNAVILEFKRKK